MTRWAAAGALLVILLAGCTADPAPTSSPVPSFTPSPSAAAPAPAFATVPVGPDCAAVMAAAAAVSSSDAAEFEFSDSVTACTSIDEWATAIRQYPEALGRESLSDDDIRVGIALTCLQALTEASITPLCAEAEAAGLTG